MVVHAEQIVTVAADTEDAFALARRILDSVGQVSHVDVTGRFLRGSTRCGLQRVRVGITAVPGKGGTRLMVETSSDGAHGKAARKGLRRVVGALATV